MGEQEPTAGPAWEPPQSSFFSLQKISANLRSCSLAACDSSCRRWLFCRRLATSDCSTALSCFSCGPELVSAGGQRRAPGSNPGSAAKRPWANHLISLDQPPQLLAPRPHCDHDHLSLSSWPPTDLGTAVGLRFLEKETQPCTEGGELGCGRMQAACMGSTGPLEMPYQAPGHPKAADLSLVTQYYMWGLEPGPLRFLRSRLAQYILPPFCLLPKSL